jgi:citrate/tricarballylate utilization protein
LLDERLFQEADRQLTICNACRYCEGICPVFPALERRTSFLGGDVVYLANLCHDCRACMPACPYTDPHELAIDIPKVMAEVRQHTYASYAFPRVFGQLFRRGSRAVGAVTVVATGLVVLAVWLARSDRMFERITGPGSFYEVVPWLFMLIPALLATAYGLLVMAVSTVRFWRATDGPIGAKIDLRAFVSATLDVLALRQMRGGGPGCAYPDEVPRHSRVVAHQLVFYGFLGTFIATVLAAIYQDVLGSLPPYPILSPAVLFGTVGGALQVVGCAALLAMKVRASGAPATRVLRSLDVAFLVLLMVTNLTGLLLLVARDTEWMGFLLALHLGVLVGLFITLPYSKFVHIIYRYAALVRNRREELLEAERSPGSR